MSFEYRDLAPTGQMVLLQARTEAKRLGDKYLGTEHLLLGMFDERPPLPSLQLLKELGISYKDVDRAIKFITGKKDPLSSLEPEDNLTAKAEGALRLAAADAMEDANRYQLTDATITDIHILKGIIDEGTGIAVGALEGVGVDLKKLSKLIEVYKPISRVADLLIEDLFNTDVPNRMIAANSQNYLKILKAREEGLAG